MGGPVCKGGLRMDAPCRLSPASGSVPWQGGRLPLPPRDLLLPGGAELRDRRGRKLKRRKGNRNPHNHRALGAEALGDAPDFLAAWLLRQPAAGHGSVPARGGGSSEGAEALGRRQLSRGCPLKADGAGLGVPEWRAEHGAPLETSRRAAMGAFAGVRALAIRLGFASPWIFPNGLRGMLGSARSN